MERLAVIHRDQKYSAIDGEYMLTEIVVKYVIHKLENGLAFRKTDDDGNLMFVCFKDKSYFDYYLKEQIQYLENK